ncbi:3'-to-5' exoribonuclease RNase R [hydrothermal vent metagenome]|uniref:exoribonuclease II n=1 Tax=hydrothermal vent metagenome TaxID=652676 RepID=A0A3B0YWS8_9ZZZZ
MSKTGTKPPRGNDPQAQREAQNYDNPVPSREFILEAFENVEGLLSHAQVCDYFAINAEEQVEGIRRRLIAMVRDGQLFCNRKQGYGPVDRFDLVKGRVDSHQDGFGFLHPDDGGDKMFMSFREMRTLMNGDRIIARVAGLDKRGRREGALVEVLERGVKQVVGRFYEEHQVYFVVPDSKNLHQDLMIPVDKIKDAQHGQIVVAAILEYPTSRSQAIGEILEVLGDHMDPGMEIDIAIRSYQLPDGWPSEAEQQAQSYHTSVQADEITGRVDLRGSPLVTIDGEDARDFDDAVYCKEINTGWKLYVAIADVSHYVASDSALDSEAIKRGNSVYFPERVIPMLPETLSNGLCSLNPQVDRLAMVCEIDFNLDGHVTAYKFYEAVIHSHARLTYNKVAAMLYDDDQTLCKEYEHVLPHLEVLDDLYLALRDARADRGAIDFESTETRIVFGKSKKIERIVPTVRNDAHKIIEECMIIANVCAAKFLVKYKIPSLYRVHKTPEEDRIQEVKKFLGPFGLSLRGGNKPEARDFAALIKEVEGRPDAHLLQTVLLRSMQQAVYSPEKFGHFGLAHSAYTHFTSPIRRYPDLLVHRAIKHLLTQGSASDYRYSKQNIIEMGEHCSMTERRADEATRDVTAWLKCEYMLDRIGDSFNGIISSVTSFGLFVELNDIYVEGLVHITSLGNDFYHFDPVGYRLQGERTAKSYRLGDPIEVELVQVNLDERKIDFELTGSSKVEIDDTKTRSNSKRKKGSRKKRR